MVDAVNKDLNKPTNLMWLARNSGDVSFDFTLKYGTMKNVIRLVVAEARLSKVYPKDIKKYLMGLYASLHLKDSEKDMERLIYYAFKNGYVLGAASQGADAQEVSDRLPDLGIEEEK